MDCSNSSLRTLVSIIDRAMQILIERKKALKVASSDGEEGRKMSFGIFIASILL